MSADMLAKRIMLTTSAKAIYFNYRPKKDNTYPIMLRLTRPYYGRAQGFENIIDILEDACEGLLATVRGRIIQK